MYALKNKFNIIKYNFLENNPYLNKKKKLKKTTKSKKKQKKRIKSAWNKNKINYINKNKVDIKKINVDNKNLNNCNININKNIDTNKNWYILNLNKNNELKNENIIPKNDIIKKNIENIKKFNLDLKEKLDKANEKKLKKIKKLLPISNKEIKKKKLLNKIIELKSDFSNLNPFKFNNYSILKKDFLKRNNLNENNMIFKFNSKDIFFKKLLIDNGWFENKEKFPFSIIFDLNYIYTDKNFEYNKLYDFQIFNHIYNNKEICTKSYLNKNLEEYYMMNDLKEFSPRTYDYSVKNSLEEFITNYKIKLILDFFKFHIKYIKTKRKEFYYITKKEIENRNNYNPKNIKFYNNSYKLNLNYISCNETRDNNFFFNIELIEECLEFLKCIKRQLDGVEDEIFYYPISKYLLEDFKNYELILKNNKNFDEYTEEEFKNIKYESYWKTPNNFILKEMIKIHYCLKNNYSNYKDTIGDNYWIIKPSSNSRGNGIFITNKLDVIINKSKENLNRVFQKYIINPILIKNEPFNNKKFDIRQWVIVKNLNNLEIYIFSEFYLRCCYKEYDLSKINELNRHLTNYSINKKYIMNKNEKNATVIEERYLREYFEKQSYDYENLIKKKIKDQVLNSILACKESWKSKNINNSYELLGYDFLIDKNLDVHLLEVNLSPACEMRTKFLENMWECLSGNILKLLYPNLQLDFKEYNYKLELFYKENNLVKNNLNFSNNLLIKSTKLNVKNEIKNDKQLKKEYLVLKLQQLYKIKFKKNI